MPIVLLGVVLLLALRGSASDSSTKPPPAASSGPAPGGGSNDAAKTADDVVKGVTAAVPVAATAATTIAGFFGGGASASTATAASAGAVGGAGVAAVVTGEILEATATSFLQGAIQGAAQGALLGGGGAGAGEAASEVVVETVATEGGVTLGATFAGIGFLAIGAAVIALFIQFVGPPLAKLYEDSKEWARKRAYGKAGVLANLDLLAMQLEQDWCKVLLQSWCGSNTFTCTYTADPAAATDPSSLLADIYPRIHTVLGTVDFEVQRLIARIARTFAIQQLHERNKTIGTFFTLSKGQTDAANESNGVALSAASFLAWADGYCALRKYTSWGLNLAPSNDPAEFNWAGMRTSLASLMGANGWALTLARLNFFGRSSGIAMCASVGYFTFYPGDTAFTMDMNALTGTGWAKVGLWLIDPATNGAVNPALSRAFNSPQTIDAHLLDANGDHNGYFPPLDVAYLAGLNPPVQKWL